MSKQFLEILFPDDVQPDDIEIITLARADTPGVARLNQARLGEAEEATPNSRPVLSRTGAKLGFLAAADLIEPPFTGAYWLEGAA